jgi:hypothetical protein
MNGSCAAAPPLTSYPTLGAMLNFLTPNLNAPLSGQQTSHQKQLACVA